MIPGKKIYLRTVAIGDTDVITAWENNPEFWEVTEEHGPFSRETISEFIQNAIDLETNGQQRFMIVGNDETPVGALDLFDFDTTLRTAGIGILIADPAQRKQGFAHDALSAFIYHCAMEKSISELRCLIYENNFPSISLFEKNGFERKGSKVFKGKRAFQFVRTI